MRWLIQLVDGVSGPAKSAEASLGGLEDSVRRLPTATAMATIGFEALISGARELGRIGIESGKFVVDMLAFKESTLESFQLMLGTKEEARGFFDQARQFGKETPFSTQQVVKGFQQLLQAGFKAPEVPVLFSAVGDVAAGKGFDGQVLDRLILAMGQIKAKGRLMGGELLQLGEAGVGRQGIFESVGKMMGIDPTQVDKAMEAGKVSAEMGINAILDTVKKVYSGGAELGQGMLNQSKTIRGVLSNIKDAIPDLFLNIDLDKSSGFVGLKKFLVGIQDALNPASEAGQKLQRIIESMLDTAGQWLGSFSLEDITKGFDTLVRGVEGFGTSFSKSFKPYLDSFLKDMGVAPGSTDTFADSMKGLGSSLGTVAGGLLKVVGLVERLAGTMDVFSNGKGSFGIGGYGDEAFHKKYWAGRAAEDAGNSTGKGYIDGMLGWVPEVESAGKALGAASVAGAAVALDAHSPSRVFEQLGGYAAQGFAQGVAGGTLGVDGAVANMVKAPSGAGGRTVSGNQVHLTIQVQGGNDSADTIARRLSELLPTQLASLFEELAIEGGAA
jgi:tape measure domain-containing protein